MEQGGPRRPGSDPRPSYNSSISAPAQSQSNHNPFLSGGGGEPVVQEITVTKKVGGWNPFEDKVQFGEISEDAMFGAEFDRLRNGSQGAVVGGGGQQLHNQQIQPPPPPRRDPFGSAPFTIAGQEKQY